MSALAPSDQETRTSQETLSLESLSPPKIFSSARECFELTLALKNREGKDCFFFVHDDAALLPPGRDRGLLSSTMDLDFSKPGYQVYHLVISS